jgi:thiaminase/transcriptional activator TenA
MSFFAQQRQRHDRLWRACAAHPFVRGIATSTLDPAKFRFYLAQDDHFLVDYSRLLALAIAKAPTVGVMGWFSRVLDTIVNGEMALHRQFAARFGVSMDDLLAVPVEAPTRAYIDHLLRVGWSGTLGEIVAAMLPCHYGYHELARGLRGAPGALTGAPYAPWIEAYASGAYAEGAEWLLRYGDELALEAGAAERARMAEAYAVSLYHEHSFWEMAWRSTPD